MSYAMDVPESARPRFVQFFEDLPDPRVKRCRRHALLEMLVIAFLAVVCGAEGWDDLHRFGVAKQEWLKERLGLSLEGGIPSDDTFRRLVARLCPEAFGRGFRAWVQALKQQTKGEVIALDGKTLRHSFDTATGQEALSLVRAWATGQRLLLGAVKAEPGSNDIPALEALLGLVDLNGAVVTADALHCQTRTARKVREAGADYVFGLKGNQAALAQDVADLFSYTDRHPAGTKEWCAAHPERASSRTSNRDHGHGRTETRKVHVLVLAPDDPDWRDVQSAWPGLRSLIRVERTRKSVRAAAHATPAQENESREILYFLSSLPGDAQELARAIRLHWRIENSLHWVLDVQMNEDGSRIRIDHAPENFATLRGIALNLLRQDKTTYGGVRARQKLAGWDNDYLVKLLV